MDNKDKATPDSMPYALVINDNKILEDRREFHKQGVWQLNVADFLKPIDPSRYYVTSGEAVTKARRLEQDLFEAAGDARRLANILQRLRGESTYLETQWYDGKLLVIRKDPRSKTKKPPIML